MIALFRRSCGVRGRAGLGAGGKWRLWCSGGGRAGWEVVIRKEPNHQAPWLLFTPLLDSPGKNTGVGCHFLLQCVKMKSLSRARLLATPWTAAYQAPLSMGFSRQEYWSGVPLPSPPLLVATRIPDPRLAFAPTHSSHCGTERFLGFQFPYLLGNWPIYRWRPLFRISLFFLWPENLPKISQRNPVISRSKPVF